MKKIALFLVLVFTSFVFGQDVPQAERDELIKFYNALNGSEWKNKLYWSTNNPVKEWAGVYVEEIEGQPHVTGISLIDNNLVGNIDLNLPYLVKLYLAKNKIENVKVKSDRLQTLYIEDNNILKSVDISEATNIVELNLSNNKLTELDLSAFNQLVDVNLNNNLLNKLDLSNSTTLVSLSLKDNKLTDVKISSEAHFLSHIDLANNKLTEFKLGNNPILETLVLDNNNIKKFELKDLKTLKGFSIKDNIVLSEISFSNVPELSFLTLNNNKLTTVDLSPLKSLFYLEMNNNPLNQGILDLSNNTELQTISIKNTSVELINMRNHINGVIVDISDKVKCIAIDNPAQKPNWDIQWMNGREGNYKTDCNEYLSTNDSKLNQEDLKIVSPLKENLVLVGNKHINKIEIYSITGQLVKTLVGLDRNISNLQTGIYIAKIYTKEGVRNRKFIKK